jgi:hypothetical protein
VLLVSSAEEEEMLFDEVFVPVMEALMVQG